MSVRRLRGRSLVEVTIDNCVRCMMIKPAEDFDGELNENEMILRVIASAEQAEAIIAAEGDKDGVPFLMIVCAGATVGLLKRALAEAGVTLKRKNS